MRRLLRRLAVWRRLRHFEAELDEELRTHQEMKREELAATGLDDAEVQVALARTFGSSLRARTESREAWLWPALQDAMQDVRFAARRLAKDRRFSGVAVLVLGTGIGINNMLFTVLNAHTIRGLPIERPQNVMYISTVDERGQPRGVSHADFLDIINTARTFSGLAAFVNAPMTLGDDAQPPDRLDGAYVDPAAFDIVGVRATTGRTFLPEDNRVGAATALLLGATAWQTRYSGDPGVIGRSVRVNGAPATIVGIVPDRSGLPSTAQVWLPLEQMRELPRQQRDARVLRVFGRVRDEVDPAQAEAELRGIAERLARDYPDTNGAVRARVVPINEQFLGRLADPAWRAFIAVGFLVLAISCANVANLFLNRARERTREVAIRTALGATRARVVRQLLIEASVLAAISGVAGFGIAVAGVRLFKSQIPDNVLPYWFDYSIDSRVLAMLLGVTAGTILVFGVIPAIGGSKTNVSRELNDHRDIGRRAARRWTAIFLTAEFALAVVMLAQIILGLRLSTPRLPSDAALDTPAVLTAALTLPADRYRTVEERVEFLDRLAERLSALPGISAASLSAVLPLGGGREREIALPAQAGTAPSLRALTVGIGPDYFRTFQLAMRRGREFVVQDGTAGQEHVIVNERAARLYFGEQDPVGQRIAFRSPEPAGSPLGWLTIVGVAPDVRQRPRPGLEVEPIVYVPYRTAASDTAVLLLRSEADADMLAPVIRQELFSLDSNVPLYRVRTMAGVIHDGGWNGRVSNLLINVLAFIAVTLATVGLYAVTAHGVHQRTPELGLRIALGARLSHITRLILGRVMMQVGVGFLVGVVCTVIWARLFWTDAERGLVALEALAIIAVVLLVLAVAATLIPLVRAARLDPVAALRFE